ncbi:MAG TPA: GDSL-type esterase/lipase family protein, partial [Polyangia bacterium]|nr:GDSL-type esterase/lipase family protein [Polyangia bacterium]
MKSALGSYRGLLSAVFLASGILISSKASAVIKVSCIGASNFSGDGSSTGHHVPDELGIALGANYVVKNLGVSGTVALFQGDLPYWNGLPGDLPHLKPALDSAPDIAIFWFGGNDAKAQNWTTHKDEFIPNYEETLRRFQALPSKPKLFIFKSMVIHDVEGIPKTVLEMEVLPKIDIISADTGAFVVPYHDAFI